MRHKWNNLLQIQILAQKYLNSNCIYKSNTMDLSRIRRTPRNARRTKLISIRITPETHIWLKKNRFSATKIFYESLRELGCPSVRKHRRRE